MKKNKIFLFVLTWALMVSLGRTSAQGSGEGQGPVLKPFDPTITVSGRSVGTNEQNVGQPSEPLNGSVGSHVAVTPRFSRLMPRNYIAVDGGWGSIADDGEDYVPIGRLKGGSFGVLYSYNYWISHTGKVAGGLGLRYMGTVTQSRPHSLYYDHMPADRTWGYDKTHYLGAELGVSGMVGPFMLYGGLGFGYLHVNTMISEPGEYIRRRRPRAGINLSFGVDYRITRWLGLGASVNGVFGGYSDGGYYDYYGNYHADAVWDIGQVNILGGLRFYF